MFDARPSKFVSETQPPASLDIAGALYFVCLGDDMLSISEQGVPRPVTADEFRWVDLEVDYKPATPSVRPVAFQRDLP
ncbi:MAG: hypothetical protein OXH09_16560 [Gammaproteobacteria bacterium]|nr:hypothetical protein [Gammaproteobacteria bacterium]